MCIHCAQEKKLTHLALVVESTSGQLRETMSIGERLLSLAERSRTLETETEKVRTNGVGVGVVGVVCVSTLKTTCLPVRLLVGVQVPVLLSCCSG